MLFACENRAVDNFLDSPSYENQMKVLKSFKDDSSIVFAEETQKDQFIKLLEEENIFAMQVALEILRLKKCNPDFKEYLLQYFGKLFQDKPEYYKKLDLCILSRSDIAFILLFPLNSTNDLIIKYKVILPKIRVALYDTENEKCGLRDTLRDEGKAIKAMLVKSKECQIIMNTFIAFSNDPIPTRSNALKDVFRKHPEYSNIYLSGSMDPIYKLFTLVKQGNKSSSEVAAYIFSNIDLNSAAGGELLIIALSLHYDLNAIEFVETAVKYKYSYQDLESILTVYDWNDEKYKSRKDEEIYRKRLEIINQVKDPKFGAIKKDITEILTKILDK